MLHHSWHYLPLAHDLIKIQENSIFVSDGAKSIKHDLDFQKDDLLKFYELKECGAVKKHIDEEYQRCSKEYNDLQSTIKTQQISEFNNTTKNLSQIKLRKAQ